MTKISELSAAIALPFTGSELIWIDQGAASFQVTFAALVAQVQAVIGIPVEGEVPTGAINGTNLVYTLAAQPIAGCTPLILKNGMALSVSEYTLTGKTLTLTTPLNPASSGSPADTIAIWYRR